MPARTWHDTAKSNRWGCFLLPCGSSVCVPCLWFVQLLPEDELYLVNEGGQPSCGYRLAVAQEHGDVAGPIDQSEGKIPAKKRKAVAGVSTPTSQRPAKSPKLQPAATPMQRTLDQYVLTQDDGYSPAITAGGSTSPLARKLSGGSSGEC